MINNVRETWLRDHLNREVFRCIKYLDLDKEGPNYGTRNKQDLTIRTLKYLHEWQEGQYQEWNSRLALRLGISVRIVKENYVDPLIKEGIIGKAGSNVIFMGAPKTQEGSGGS